MGLSNFIGHWATENILMKHKLSDFIGWRRLNAARSLLNDKTGSMSTMNKDKSIILGQSIDKAILFPINLLL
jgi:hypothetical protein